MKQKNYEEDYKRQQDLYNQEVENYRNSNTGNQWQKLPLNNGASNNQNNSSANQWQRTNYSQPSQNAQPTQASQPNTASVAPVSQFTQNVQPTQNAQPTQTPNASQPTVQQASTPQYSSQWQSELDNLMSQIMNREKFSFDLNGDAMYQQYADMYKNNADMAMQNAMGQASAMTGGYGSSYSQAAGQQAYAQQMQGLNDVAMDMYNNALNRYLAEGDALNQQYSMLASREAQDYQRYLDTVARQNWQAEFDRAGEQWNNLYGEGGFYETEREDSQAHDKELQKESQDFTKGMSEQEREWANEDWERMYGEGGYYVTEADKNRQHDKDMQEDSQAYDKENRDFLYGYFDENGVYHDGYYGRESDKEFDRMYGEDGYYTKINKQDQSNWQAEFDREGEQWDALYGEGGINNPKFEGNFMYDADGNLREGYTTTNTNLFDESGNFKQASISQKIEEDGNKSGYVEWNVGGKTIKLQAGYNPYTQTKNPDTQYGTIGDGGYQPDNVASYYGNDENAVSKSKLTPTALDQLEVNGVWQTVYKDNAGKDSRYWVWDDANNEYIDVTEQMKEENPELPLKPNKGNTSTSSNKGAGGKSTYDPFTAVNR